MPIWVKLEDAESLLFPDGVTHVDSATDFLGWQAAHVAQRRIATVRHMSDTIRARVNWGRWLADCLQCYSPMFTHPVWKIGCCAECGASYRGILFPEDLEEITRLLLERPRRQTQNWEPGESVLKLRIENLLHKLAA